MQFLLRLFLFLSEYRKNDVTRRFCRRGFSSSSLQLTEEEEEEKKKHILDTLLHLFR